MGAGASLAPIAEDILELDAAKTYDLNGLSTRTKLSKEVLESIRRKSMTPLSRRKSSVKNRENNRSQLAHSMKYEVPPHVNEFLDGIGIPNFTEETGGGAAVNVSARIPNMQSERTTKLVGHVFECLGALQHLVRANQSVFPSNFDETQSVNDQNIKSIGRLLHEMVTIYGLCGDTITALLEADPDAAGVEDNLGRLPLHVCCDRDEPWMDVLQLLVEAKPEALNCRDGGGRLPLHIALDRQKPSLEVVKYLVRANPAAASARRGVGRLPIHYACFSDEPSVDIIQCLLKTHAEGAQATDVYGKLPLHYVADKVCPSFSSIQCLLEAYPPGAAVCDSHHCTPLHVVVKTGNIDTRIINLLLRADPLGASRQGQHGKLPLHIAVESQNPSELTVRMLVAAYPQGVLMAAKITPGNAVTNINIANNSSIITLNTPGGLTIMSPKDSPLQIAMAGRRFNLARVMLLVCPDNNSSTSGLLSELNWMIRRVAFLITQFGSPFPCNFEVDMQGLHASKMIISHVNSSRGGDFKEKVSHTINVEAGNRRWSATSGVFPFMLVSSLSDRGAGLCPRPDSSLGPPGLGGRLPPISSRPTPYARMMSSASNFSEHSNSNRRSFNSEEISPRPIINILHGLSKVNIDIWRLVILYL